MSKFSRLPGWVLMCLSATAAGADAGPEQARTSRLQSLGEVEALEIKPRALQIRGWKTLTGTKVLFVRTHDLPMFDIHVSFAAGSARDGRLPGLAATTFSLLNEGIPGKDLSAIAETFDGLGAQWEMDIDHDRAVFSLRSLSDPANRLPAINLLTQIFSEPLLSEDRLPPVKNELRAALTAEQGDAADQALQRIKKLLAPDSPYGLPVYGTESGLSAVSRAAVKDFHRRYYAARHAQITLVGDLTLEQAQAISLQISNALPTPPDSFEASATATPGDLQTSHLELALKQTHIVFAQISVPRRHADHAALFAAGEIFGGGSNSRLMNELRHKRGRVYDAYGATIHWSGGAGLLTIALQTGNSFSASTVALVRGMLNDFLRDGPTALELEHLKRRLANRNVRTSASNRQILARLAEINRYDLPLDLDYTMQQVQKLTVDDIKLAMNRHLSADRWVSVTAGATVEQQPLPASLPAAVDQAEESMCRADTGFVAS
ncbi:insulinase family protein [Pseudomonas moraviensis subsp. stanleyae]|uniref:M16 family metallopeptidase n=1 Tax=Pseudomonas moraviensis TaxID=321662 RepID=UPI002E303C49|nr:pitrilysin family protein [Pseudomonas moraviensis]MED7668071.1 insulinase family protein [Pseudomonas moraviensis subsp. stanleyae]